MSALEELLGKIYDNGVEVEGLGGLNFIGFTIMPDTVNMRYNIAISGAATTSDDVSNESSVTGSTVTAALETLATLIGTNTTNIATNTSSISTLNGRQIIAGTNMSGGGTLAADRTLSLAAALTGMTSIEQTGSPGTSGFLRVVYNTTVMSGKDSVGTSRNVLRLGSVNPDELTYGSSTWANHSFEVKTTTGYWRVYDGGTELVKVTSAGTVFGGTGGVITGVGSINGAQVAAPVQGTAITTTATVNVSGGNNYDVTAAGGAYTITLGTSGTPIDGEIISFRTTNSLANAITVTNGGTGGGNIGPSSGTMPASVKGVYDFRWNASGTKWEYAGMKRCA